MGKVEEVLFLRKSSGVGEGGDSTGGGQESDWSFGCGGRDQIP